MKSLMGKLGVILIGLLIFHIGCQKTVLRNESTKGVDWKYYNSNEMYLTQYYTKKITHPSKNIVRVWERWNLTERGVLNWMMKFGKEYENLSYLIILWEINCADKMIRLLSMSHYSKEEEMLYRSSPRILLTPDWESIGPDTPLQAIYTKVCK